MYIINWLGTYTERPIFPLYFSFVFTEPQNTSSFTYILIYTLMSLQRKQMILVFASSIRASSPIVKSLKKINVGERRTRRIVLYFLFVLFHGIKRMFRCVVFFMFMFKCNNLNIKHVIFLLSYKIFQVHL